LEKKEIDQLYHLLRRVSNYAEGGVQRGTSLTAKEQIGVLYGLCRHLLAGGDYLALVQFSQFYGESFLVEPVSKIIKNRGWKPGRVVEFGAGLGWFGRGLAGNLGMLPIMSVDKRPWPLINLVKDLEVKEDKADILHSMKKDDLIVACDMLHCLEDPYEVMAGFDEWHIAVLEYMPENDDFRHSYSEQITRYGANPLLSLEGLAAVFPGRKSTLAKLDPYVLLLVEPAK